MEFMFLLMFIYSIQLDFKQIPLLNKSIKDLIKVLTAFLT